MANDQLDAQEEKQLGRLCNFNYVLHDNKRLQVYVNPMDRVKIGPDIRKRIQNKDVNTISRKGNLNNGNKKSKH